MFYYYQINIILWRISLLVFNYIDKYQRAGHGKFTLLQVRGTKEHDTENLSTELEDKKQAKDRNKSWFLEIE